MPFDNGTRLKDILENKVDEKYYISEEKVKKFIKNIHTYESNTSNEQHFIGNINRPDLGTGYAGGVWDKNNISHTLTTMQGGGRQPHIMTGIVSNCGCLLYTSCKGFVVLESLNSKSHFRCQVGLGFCQNRIIRLCLLVLISMITTVFDSINPFQFFNS